MPYGFSGDPPALPALPGFAGGSPLFKPGSSGGNLGAPGEIAGGPNPFQTNVNGSATLGTIAAPSDPCSGIIPCTFTNINPCFALATCRIEEGAKSAGIYLAAAGIVVAGVYLLFRK